MFGYVRPGGRLSDEDRKHFQSAYCGLCHTLGRRCGMAARLILNYDFTFLAMLLSESSTCQTRRCPLHPLRGRACACQNEALERSADYSVILLWWQLQDGIADHGFWGAIRYRLAAALLRRAYRKARFARPGFDESARRELAELARLEAEGCPSVDLPADRFARLLAGIAGEEEGTRRRVLEQMLYHLGRWIYLADAADDLKRDLRRGNYNPLALRFAHEGGVLTPESRQELGKTMDGSVRAMAAAFELAEFGAYRGVIENVIYEGLYLVGAAVLNGTFRRRKGQAKET
ncbi:MAG: hypothetical protein J5482_05455 [Oscillospiraceae bacterium]|nr:hypothetical protein [Oscillospiraceae bacterium]